MLRTTIGKVGRKLWEAACPSLTELPYRIALVKHNRQLPTLTPSERTMVETCKREGICVTSLQELGLGTTAKMLESAQEQLAVMESVHSTNADQTLGDEASPMYPQIFAVKDLPNFAHWGEESALLRIVENYIGLAVAFQGVHLRRDFSNKKPITTELWHRDLEDRRMLKAIVHLTDVEEAHGSFEYIPKSQMSFGRSLRIQLAVIWQIVRSRLAGKRDVIGIDDQTLNQVVPQSEWQACVGSAGTVLLVDPTAIFHHGRSRQAGRSTLFFVYTAENPLRPECCTQYSDQTFARPSALKALVESSN